MLRQRLLIATTVVIATSIAQDSFPTCGECWCVPDDGGTAPCPSPKPQTVFDDATILGYRNKTPNEIYTLSCNPYTDSYCETTPSQNFTDLGDAAVCTLIYDEDADFDCTRYSLVTFPSLDSFEADPRSLNAAVTHFGSCGLCSTAQDLSVYLTEDFTAAGKKCATLGLANETAGLACYEKLGLTHECAKIWNFDGIYDGTECLAPCASNLLAPNNGPPPACELNPCLECDEVAAGPAFSALGGRTRRRSGLLSEIVRNCSSIATGVVHDPALGCPSSRRQVMAS